ncbi:MAG: glucose-1-phosphate cytidylyltransferase [Patescibacteria group bacterium]
MKAVILAGGFGTRLSEETGIRPKPMVEIGGKPMLWHIMKLYSAHGINDFIICCGYKSHYIKEYFANYHLYRSDITFDLQKHSMEIHKNGSEPWRVTLVETGETSMTGGRLKKVQEYIGNETFCFTYGDGVTNANINEIIDFHKKQNTLATMTAVQPPGRFGAFTLHDTQAKITSFKEKPKGDGAWINGGFFVLEPGIFKYIDNDLTTWEKEPLQALATEGELSVYKHSGYWQNMDTLHDKMMLEKQWQTGKAPWKVLE